MPKGKPTRQVQGRLIVFEGADGSGKTTQAKLLLSYLRQDKAKVQYISFPRYKESLWADLIEKYLLGKLGKIDPYLLCSLYAGDRLAAKPMIKNWIDSSNNVIANRYLFSNMAYGAANIKKRDRQLKFIEWVEELEFQQNKIPKDDIVIFLYVPVRVSRKLMSHRELDVNEKNLAYLEKVLKIYEVLNKTRKNWVRINCTKSGKILSKDEIHARVLEALKNRNLL